MKKLKKKLSGKSGFTLAELLIAITVLVLVTTSIGLVMSGTSSAFYRVTLRSEASVLMGTLTTAISDELSYAKDLDGAAGTYSSLSYGSGAALATNSDGHIVVTAAGRAFPLLSEKAYTSGLKAGLSVTYGYPCRVLLELYDASGNTAASQTFSVMPLNSPS